MEAKMAQFNILKCLQELKDAGWKAFLYDGHFIRLKSPRPIKGGPGWFCPITAIAAYRGGPIVPPDKYLFAAGALGLNLDKARNVAKAADKYSASDNEIARLRKRMLKILGLSSS